MRLRSALVLLFPSFLAAGCGGGSPSPGSVVRAWSHSINTEDNEAAAELFARGARVVQSGRVLVLRTKADALRWNAAFPCSGRIVSISTRGDTATATFVLGHRERSRCDGPGSKATALFRVTEGKIVLWHQTASERPPPPAEPI